MVGTPEAVTAALDRLTTDLAAVGLGVISRKTEVWSPDPTLVSLPQALQQYRRALAHEGVTVLGTPVAPRTSSGQPSWPKWSP